MLSKAGFSNPKVTFTFLEGLAPTGTASGTSFTLLILCVTVLISAGSGFGPFRTARPGVTALLNSVLP